MTPTVNEATTSAIMSASYESLTRSVGVIAILLLIALLIQHELVRAAGNARTQAWFVTLRIVIVPLLLAFVVIVLARLAGWLGFD